MKVFQFSINFIHIQFSYFEVMK